MLIEEPSRPYVVHIATLAERQAMATAERVAQAVAARGIAQVLLALDEGPVPRDVRGSPVCFVANTRDLQAEYSRRLGNRAPYAVHLHGTRACLLGLRALKGAPLPARFVYTPHQSPAGLPWASVLVGHLLQGRLASVDHVALAAGPTEAQVLSRLLGRSAEVLPYPVNDVYFEAPRKEEPRPRIVADGAGAEALELVTRLSVLLNGGEAIVAFSWLGGAEPDARAQLRAASVSVVEAAGDGVRAHELSRACLFIHACPGRHPARAAAEAMAAGVPCLASDTPDHRALIRHGETGYICTSERDFIEKAALLLRDRGERERLGEAARADAERRFTSRHFENAVRRAYGLGAGWPIEELVDRAPPVAPPAAHKGRVPTVRLDG